MDRDVVFTVFTPMKEVASNRNVDEDGDNGRSHEDGHDDARKTKNNNDTKSISQNPYESFMTIDKNTKEIFQNTHWLLIATTISAACMFTALKTQIWSVGNRTSIV